jgi:hypothetical protein
VTEFGFPLLSRVAVVQRDPDGFSALKQAEIVNRACGSPSTAIRAWSASAGRCP